jgi:hypothetical protein
MFKHTLRFFILLFCSMIVTPAIQAEALKDIQKTAKQSKTAEVASQTMAVHSEALRQLMLALYQANPQELKKSTQVSAAEMVQWAFEGPFGWKFDGVRRLQGVDALNLAVDETFPGDRVLALIAGLHTMLAKAYGGKTEYDFSGEVNPQYLYNAARNIEIVRVKINQLNRIKQSNSLQQFVLLDGNNSTDLTQQLSKMINRIDTDANRLANQKQQAIQLLDKSSAELISWQLQ